jgi:DNA repair protein RecO (recombination protein O)
MNRLRTRGVVLRRVNYGEADRIITFLTADYGQVSAMAKGVRRQGSKLAGAIELFSESDVSFIKGKGELDHLLSSRMMRHFGHIVSDYERLTLGYEVIKQIHKASREFNEPKLYGILITSLEALDDLTLPLPTASAWFKLNLLAALGQQPNLLHDTDNQKLSDGSKYTLLPDDGAFKEDKQGNITPVHIKAWRVLLTTTPTKAKAIGGLEQAIEESTPALDNLFEYQFS